MFVVGLGFMVFVIPGIWVYAVFSVMAPAVVIERAGYGGLGRSASLTRQYRWPVAGAYFLSLICAVLIYALGFLIVSLVSSVGGVSALIISVLVFAVLSTLGTGLVSIVTALVYARLREIKEGVAMEDIATVFD